MFKNLRYAVLSGFSASLGSTFGKISGLSIFGEIFVLRVVFFIIMLLCNSFALSLFVKALHRNSSSLIATVLSSASNYIFSAFIGFLIFGESTTLIWWSGMSLIIFGLLFIISDEDSNKKSK